MTETLYLIDGSGFIFRAYHALPPLNRPDGTPVNAVLGFTNMLIRLLKDKNAHHVAVIFDAARKNFRNDIYPEYKAHRPPPPEDLIPQFPLIRDATRAFALPSIEQEGFEADDLIATYARLAVERDQHVVIISSDKDLMQLVRPGVELMDPMKQTMMGETAVFEKFGVAPNRVIDVQALCGDSVDNVPGVPGIGVKTAALLINEYGDLETLLSRAHEIKQDKRRDTLMNNADLARVSYRLVKLDDHVPVITPLDGLIIRDLSMPNLRAFLEEQGFHSTIARMGKLADKTSSAVSVPDGNTAKILNERTVAAPRALPSLPSFPDQRTYIIINTISELEKWVDLAHVAGMLAIDTETTNLTPAQARLVGISLCITPGVAAYIPVGHRESGDLFGHDTAENPQVEQLPLAEVMRVLKPILEDKSVLKIGHNMKYDLQMFYPHDIEIFPVADTMLLSYALDNTAHGHGLEELGRDMLGVETISYDAVTGTGKSRITFDCVPIDRACDYAAEDADLTMRLYHIFEARLSSERANLIYHDIDLPIIPVIARMEYTGVRVDTVLLQKLSHDFGEQLVALEADIHAAAGHPFNVNSPKQMGTVLFDELGLTGASRTKTGDWSTSADILEDLADQGHTIVQKILDYRGLAKLKSTYTDALQTAIHAQTGRVHTSYGLALTSTGRLSSSDPNLQNIPIRTEQGRKIRRAFITDPGWTLISVDYSQVELRLIAEIADIKALIQAFYDGADIHAITASRVFGVKVEGMDPMIRRQAKAINFGIIYGISGFGLARQLGCDTSTANGYIKAYFEQFPELKSYFDRTKADARANGFVRTSFGRKILVEGINDKNGARRSFAERQAINAPIQGTAADLMKIALARVPGALHAAGLQARLLLQVHDELVLESPVSQAEEAAQVVKRIMQDASPFKVPVIADYGIGEDWDAAH